MGKHNVYAALFAFAIAHMEGLSREEIREGLLAYAPRGLRQHMAQVGDWTFFQDCYNASPESMRAALDVLVGCARRAGGKSVAVLGEMLELGTQSDNLHRAVGAYAAECGVDLLLTLGHGSEMIAKGAIEAGLSSEHIDVNNDIENVSHTAESLLRMAQSGDVILFKASRSIRMERVLACWKLQFEER
jgi:UDP-N-acetylmuramyl pentapeptide synthase